VIIGVDRFDERLELATSFGATHVINTSTLEGSVVDKIRSLTGGVGPSITIDTTGNMGLIGNGMEFTANRGQMILLGVPPMDGLLSVHLVPFMQVRRIDHLKFLPRLTSRRRESCCAVVLKEMLRHQNLFRR